MHCFFVQHFMQLGGAASFCTNTRRFCQLPPPRESWTKLHAAQAISRPTKRSHQSCSTRALQPQILFRINLHLRFFDSDHHDKASHFPINHLGTSVTSRQNGQRTVSQPQSQPPSPQKKIGTGGMLSTGGGRSLERLAVVGDVKSVKTPETDPLLQEEAPEAP